MDPAVDSASLFASPPLMLGYRGLVLTDSWMFQNRERLHLNQLLHDRQAVNGAGASACSRDHGRRTCWPHGSRTLGPFGDRYGGDWHRHATLLPARFRVPRCWDSTGMLVFQATATWSSETGAGLKTSYRTTMQSSPML